MTVLVVFELGLAVTRGLKPFSDLPFLRSLFIIFLLFSLFMPIRTTCCTPFLAGETPLKFGDKPLELGEIPLELGENPLRCGDNPLELGEAPLVLGLEDCGEVKEDNLPVLGEAPLEFEVLDLGVVFPPGGIQR